MSDQMIPPQGMPPQGMPQQGAPRSPDAVTKNMSLLNPVDALALVSSGKVSPNTSIRDMFAQIGIDVDGPVTQLIRYGQRMQQNVDPLTKMRNIAADTALQKGGQMPARPGVKPMVQPPGAPSPTGMEGLLNQLGGRNAGR